MLSRFVAVILIALVGCSDEEDCDLPVSAYCQEQGLCDQGGDFERALDTALAGGREISQIRVCSDRRIVRFGGDLGGSFNTYDPESGALTSVHSFSDAIVPGRCSMQRYGAPDIEAPCDDACVLFGIALGEEGLDDPVCEGAVAEPVIELCQTIAADEYDPACAECACRECYAQTVSPMRGEQDHGGEVIPNRCLDEHCPEECED